MTARETRPQLQLSHDADADWITAIQVGQVDDGVLPERWEPISCRAAWLLDEPGGAPIGFRVQELTSADLEHGEGWAGADFAPFSDGRGPRFDVPSLALVDVTATEVLLAAIPFFGGRSSLNRFYFREALTCEDPEQTLTLWRLCLQTGDQMAHYGLGLELYTHGEMQGAYDHLRFYSTLATHDAWTWCWLGRAALELGRHDEAVEALERAVAIGVATGLESDADETLEWLRGEEVER